jgi:hypothetical protein
MTRRRRRTSSWPCARTERVCSLDKGGGRARWRSGRLMVSVCLLAASGCVSTPCAEGRRSGCRLCLTARRYVRTALVVVGGGRRAHMREAVGCSHNITPLTAHSHTSTTPSCPHSKQTQRREQHADEARPRLSTHPKCPLEPHQSLQPPRRGASSSAGSTLMWRQRTCAAGFGRSGRCSSAS